MHRVVRVIACAATLVALGSCATSRARVDSTTPLAAAEHAYLDARDARDRLDVARALGSARGPARRDLAALEARARATAEAARARVEAIAPSTVARLDAEDRRALETMRRVLARELADVEAASDSTSHEPSDAESARPDCAYDPAAVARGDSALARLTGRAYACYADAVLRVPVDDTTSDRLSVLAALGREPDGARRRRLFLALDTVWRAMNRDDGGATSPYRVLVPLSAARWRADGSPVDASLGALGLRADDVERWLVRALARWRDATPRDPIEPWDWWYAAGAAGRRLAPRIPRERLGEIAKRAYASLGADPRALGVRYDLEPRHGKTPVAYTTFGARPRRTGATRTTGEPWVFATYRAGGLDNLNELLHETGHAVHIAAIDARPAFDDWPDSDTFTEALADVLAADAYEGGWQWRWLGDSATTAENRRAKLAPVMLDIAWALFELRMHRDPSADPNVVWTALTRDYLHIAPHPELSWWAMRGQLIDAPGYMMNYALGAILTADVRARARELRGPFWSGAGGDETWYAWLSSRLYRFGLAAPSGEVLRRYLGRAPTPDALLGEIDALRAEP